MTKRFTISNHCRIKDETQIGFFNIANNIDAKRVCDLLNELNDENKQLKFELKECMEHKLFSRRELEKENEQLKQSNERIVKDIDLALGFIKHKGYSLQDIKDYEDAKKEFEEDLAYYRKGDVE